MTMIKRIALCAAVFCCFNAFGAEGFHFDFNAEMTKEEGESSAILALEIANSYNKFENEKLILQALELIESGKGHLLFRTGSSNIDPFSSAIEKENIGLVSKILEVFKEKGMNIIQVLAENGKNPLCWAAARNNINMFKLLFDSYNSMIGENHNGYNLMRAANRLGETPLHYATSNTELMQYILENGGGDDITAEENYGNRYTPVDITILNHRFESLRILVAHARRHNIQLNVQHLREVLNSVKSDSKYTSYGNKDIEEYEKIRRFLNNPADFRF